MEAVLRADAPLYTDGQLADALEAIAATPLIPWIDAAMPPSVAQAQAAYNMGFRACGFYPMAPPHTDPYRTWTPAEVAVLRQARLLAVPIVVPVPTLSAVSPTALAQQFYTELRHTYGMTPTAPVLYDGPHLVNTGRVTGDVWLPIYTPRAPASVGAGSSIQWGQGSIQGWTVDFNVANPSFPFQGAMVFDLEHNVLNTTPVAAALAWYLAAEAASLNLIRHPTPVPPPAPAPTPAPKPTPTPVPVPPAHRNVYTPLTVDGAPTLAQAQTLAVYQTVKALQFVCFNGNVALCDGKFGHGTAGALQAHVGVKVDGIVGPATVDAVQRRVGAKVDGAWGTNTTAALQRALNLGSF